MKKINILKNGELSCAYFVSSILSMLNLIDRIHCTVDGVVENLEKYNWKKIRKLKKGCILVWEEEKFGKEIHKHIGFYLGNNKAISNSSKKKFPTKHHFTFGTIGGKPKRNIVAMYWNKELN